MANYFFCQAIHQVLCSFFEAAYEKKGEFFEQFLADNLDGYIIEKLIDSIVYPILEVGIKKRNFSRSDFDFRNLDNYVAIQRHAYIFDPCSLSLKHRSFSRLLTDLKKEESSVNSQVKRDIQRNLLDFILQEWRLCSFKQVRSLLELSV